MLKEEPKWRNIPVILQSVETCIVNDMPDAAVKLGAVSHLLSPPQIGETLGRLANEKK